MNRFDVYLVALDPTRGSEIKKSRPCVVISPDEMNRALATVIVVPLTSNIRNYPTPLPVTFPSKHGDVALVHSGRVDKQRLHQKLGSLRTNTGSKILDVLSQMFSLQQA